MIGMTSAAIAAMSTSLRAPAISAPCRYPPHSISVRMVRWWGSKHLKQSSFSKKVSVKLCWTFTCRRRERTRNAGRKVIWWVWSESLHERDRTDQGYVETGLARHDRRQATALFEVMNSIRTRQADSRAAGKVHWPWKSNLFLAVSCVECHGTIYYSSQYSLSDDQRVLMIWQGLEAARSNTIRILSGQQEGKQPHEHCLQYFFSVQFIANHYQTWDEYIQGTNAEVQLKIPFQHRVSSSAQVST